VAAVMGMFGAWGRGLFHGDKCLEAVPEFYSEDFIFDVRAPTQNTGMFKIYEGVDGACAFLQNLERFDLTDFRVDNAYPGKGDQVLVQVSYKPKLATSKTSALDRVHDGQIWTVKDGKLVRDEILIGGPLAFDSLLGETMPIKSDDDTKLIQGAFKAWGAGKFHGDACLDASKKFFADDIVVDASAPMENTDMMMVYRGIDDFCNKWIKNLERIPFTDFTPFQFYSKSPGTVVVQVMYGLEGDDACTTFVDTQKWTVNNGKISKFKILWGNTKAWDKYFANLKLSKAWDKYFANLVR
jgi:hypothetical protein